MRRQLAAAAAGLALLALAACSSAGSPAAGPGSPASGAQASGGSPAALVAQAKNAVNAALARPATLPITGALKTKPPAGKTVIFLQCEEVQCPLQGVGVQQAAKALGWNFRVLNFQAANPATLVTALNTALQYHPIAVFFSGVPLSVWQSVEPKYKAVGAYIVPSSVPGVTPDSTIITSLASGPLYASAGKLLADEVTALSGGKANVLFTTVPSYNTFGPTAQEYTAELKRVCPACTSQTLNATITQVTSNLMVPAVVSALKRNPNIKYVASVDGDFLTGLPSALSASGISPSSLKIVTFSGTAGIQQYVKTGQFYSTTGWSYYYEGWLGVDAVLRAMEGMPISAEHETLPIPMMVQSNVGTPANSVDFPANYAQQFEQLWKLAS